MIVAGLIDDIVLAESMQGGGVLARYAANPLDPLTCRVSPTIGIAPAA